MLPQNVRLILGYLVCSVGVLCVIRFLTASPHTSRGGAARIFEWPCAVLRMLLAVKIIRRDWLSKVWGGGRTLVREPAMTSALGLAMG